MVCNTTGRASGLQTCYDNPTRLFLRDLAVPGWILKNRIYDSCLLHVTNCQIGPLNRATEQMAHHAASGPIYKMSQVKLRKNMQRMQSKKNPK